MKCPAAVLADLLYGRLPHGGRGLKFAKLQYVLADDDDVVSRTGDVG